MTGGSGRKPGGKLQYISDPVSPLEVTLGHPPSPECRESVSETLRHQPFVSGLQLSRQALVHRSSVHL